jgi:hypothetical protein
MNAVYGNAARLCSVARQKKRDAQEVKKCGGLPRVNVPMCEREGRRKVHGRPRLLYVDEEVALEDVLPFFVLLGLFVRLVLKAKAWSS